ncbi:CPBP family intramembrane glutamic endopeptidase [Chryseomicrobium palamuruense]|uniref:CPBP family intramembrane glutamic endopeptidase n=1 Tax=Chryseomicrobium palamuruense TaxID=682973 RepID=A0ABV8UWB5_9BACL
MSHQKIAFSLLITYVIMQLSGAVGPIPFLFLFERMGTEDPQMQAVGWWIFSSMLAAVVVFFYFIRKDKTFLKPLGPKPSSTGAVIGWGFIGFFMVLFGQAFAAGIEQLLGVEPGSENTAIFIEIARSVPVVIFAIAIFAPILEEILFRRILFGMLLPRSNFFIAALISSIMFGIIHFEFTHIILYSVSGFIFAFIYYKTKRIAASILAHMLLNSFVVLVQFFQEDLQRFAERYGQLFIFFN